MTTATPDRIEQTLLEHLEGEVDCRLLSEEDGRIGCLTPLEYANGDRIVVWVRARERDFEVTDYGEALADSRPTWRRDQESFRALLQEVCRGQGVEYAQGRLTVRCEWAVLGEFVWRLATAAAQLSQATNAYRARRPQRDEGEFVGIVERALRERQLSVEREYTLEGRSGHEHRATLFVPTADAVLEPVGGHWNQATATYAKLGDLASVNGFGLYSLLDDREGPLHDDVAGLLVQVSRVVAWSRREEWVATLQ